MGENTEIAWCDSTFNPWIGCTKVSPGCAHCYAETLMDHRYGKVKWGKGNPRQRTSAANWKLPLRWNKEAEMTGSRRRVFCASLADWLDEEVPIEWLSDYLQIIHDTTNLDHLLLTKRPENFPLRLRHVIPLTERGADLIHCWLTGFPPSNVWIGASVENQEMADKRIPALLKIPAKVRFLSVEPMLGLVNLNLTAFRAIATTPTLTGPEPAQPAIVRYGPQIDWVIFGGESGTSARRCNVEWIRDGVRQCREAGAKVFVKQLGKYVESDHPTEWPEGTNHRCSGPVLKDSKGGDMSEWPEDLRVREFPL